MYYFELFIYFLHLQDLEGLMVTEVRKVNKEEMAKWEN